MATPRQLLETAFAHHRSGNWQQAANLYQQLLDQDPNQPDAWHLFGVLAHQLGDQDTAIQCIQRAIALHDQNPDFYNNLGEAYRAKQAWQLAIESYHQALALRPSYGEVWMNLGLVWQSRAELDTAIDCYQKSLKLQPNLWKSFNNLGVLYKQQKRYDQAITALQQAITIFPSYGTAYDNLGLVFQSMADYDQAIVAHQRAIAIQPEEAMAYNHLGNAFQAKREIDRAIEQYQIALTLNANFAEAHLNLGNAFCTKRQFLRAITYYENAIALKPQWTEAWVALGDACREYGQIDQSLQHYQTALSIDADHPLALWNYHLMLPIVYETTSALSAWRNRFMEGLNTVRLWTQTAEPQKALQGLGCTTNFYLQYQGKNDRALQQTFGELAHQIMAQQYPQWALAVPRCSHSKIRVGFISNFFREHTVAKLFMGWIQQLDKAKFSVFTYFTDKVADGVTAQIQSHSDRFYALSTSLEDICGRIRSDALEVLIFTDIGMCATVDKIAALRLAPIQCLAWGHPITSGLPTIDYFLSSELMEPPEAESHYTEQLIPLPGIGIYYPQPSLPEPVLPRPHFGLSDGEIVYLSCQSLYKYLPQFDFVFPSIASQVPRSKFVFIESLHSPEVTRIFQTRLEQAFSHYALDWNAHCHFVSRLQSHEYFSLNAVSDIFLDTIEWSGGNTTLEAIACGLPIVTTPGAFMRGRHSYAMLQQMGISETIGKDIPEYIQIAVELGVNSHLRAQVQAKMAAARALLYEDPRGVRALENSIEQWCRDKVPRRDP